MVERTIHKEVVVQGRPENIFSFFSDAQNLNYITPSWLNFKVLNPDVKLKKGSRIEYALKWRGVPLRWVSEITDWNPPRGFVDKQIKGPYKTWIHKHEFVPENEATRIIDEVRYLVPGAFLEPLVHRLFVGPDVRRIFEFRTNMILKLFEARPSRPTSARPGLNGTKFVFLLLLLLMAFHASAQHQHNPPPQDPKQEEHSAHQVDEVSKVNEATNFLMGEGAGTAVNPEPASMSMPSKKIGDWDLMTHGYAFLNTIQQSGPRGEDKVFSTNHLMFIGSREINERSTLLLRGMFSLEPATITDREYPLLFQTGETAFDEPIIDGQHPHDLFMELSIQYAIQLNKNTLLHFYAAPVGDPALGPVAYPHRVSAEELPQATLSHHLQDSTHIVFDVLTAGIKYKFARVEFSGFHGTEPDEERWNIDQGAINSWATRFTLTPTPEWVAQFSTGRLKDPEVHEPGDIHRTTASVTNYTPLSNGFWTTSLIWGHNRKIELDRNLNSYAVETLFQFQNKNYLTGRLEVVDKDELFSDSHEIRDEEIPIDSVFRITAFTFGYARDFNFIPGYSAGIGANVSLYSFPSVLENFYGENPKGFLIYFRIGSAHHSQHGAGMKH